MPATSPRYSFIKRARLALCAVLIMLALAILARGWLQRSSKIQARSAVIQSAMIDAKDAQNLQMTTLDTLRGDYLVTLARPPFRAKHWTVNVYTGRLTPWQSSK